MSLSLIFLLSLFFASFSSVNYYRVFGLRMEWTEVNGEPTESEYARIDTLRPNQIIKSPLTITGEARGTWFFEASFPIILAHWDGLIMAQAKDDWMTEDFVPFEAKLVFTIDPSTYSNNGTLIFKKDNPSGLPNTTML